MAQLTGEVAYLHQACALCFAMRDNLATAVVSTLLCETMLHATEGSSRSSPKEFLVVVQYLLSGWNYFRMCSASCLWLQVSVLS